MQTKEIEQRILGHIIGDPEKCQKAINSLSADDFADETAKKIFESIITINGEVDIVSVGESLNDYKIPSRLVDFAANDIPGVFDKALTALREIAQKRQLKNLIDAGAGIDEIKIYVSTMGINKNNLIAKGGLDLMLKDVSDIDYVFGDILTSNGVFLLAGAPKMGKSFFALQLSVAVANGRMFISKKTKKCKTLYLDLETSERSLKRRLKDYDPCELNNWYYLHQEDLPERIDGGLESKLESFILENNIKFVVVDVFARIKGIKPKGLTDYEHDYNTVGKLKQIASKCDCCILILSHTTKLRYDDDVFKGISGSVGMTGCVDGSMVLNGARNEAERKLYISTREGSSDELVLSFDNCVWKYCGTNDEIQKEREEVEFLQNPIVVIISEMMASRRPIVTYPNEIFERIINHDGYWPGKIPTSPKDVAAELKRLVYPFARHGLHVVIGNKRTTKGYPINIQFKK